MLNVILAVLLCAILIYSENNTLKTIAIAALLIQAFYGRKRNLNEGFEVNTATTSSSLSEEESESKSIREKRRQTTGYFKNSIEEILNDIFKNDNERLTKKEVEKRAVASFEKYMINQN